jgi:hypothetical protein
MPGTKIIIQQSPMGSILSIDVVPEREWPDIEFGQSLWTVKPDKVECIVKPVWS